MKEVKKKKKKKKKDLFTFPVNKIKKHLSPGEDEWHIDEINRVSVMGYWDRT